MEEVVVIKQNAEGREVWRYRGQVVAAGADWVIVEALFDRPDRPFHGITLKEGDRFVETYYSQLWYNVLEIYDRDSGDFKAYYCNVTRPAEIGQGQVAYADLALDLLVYPDGQQLVLDEDEFAALQLGPEDERQAWQALRELQHKFSERL